MDATLKNSKTCLFAGQKSTDQELAAIYLHHSPYSIEEFHHVNWKNDKRCENGSAHEQELVRYIMEYSDDQLQRVRNSQWAPEIIRVLREEPNSSYFFAFGASHFLGEYRIQTFLEAAGFNVEYVDADDPLNHEPKRDRGFWYWFKIYREINIFVMLISLLIWCTKIESPENNTNADDIRDLLRFLRNLCESETRHFHAD